MITPNTTPILRARIVDDPDARFEECNGEPRPLTAAEYAETPYYTDGQRVPYAQYLAYQGNPARHVYLGIVIDRQCACCQQWEAGVASVWRIDYMDDDPEVQRLNGTYTIAEIEAWPSVSYLRDVVRDLCQEVTVLSMRPADPPLVGLAMRSRR